MGAVIPSSTAIKLALLLNVLFDLLVLFLVSLNPNGKPMKGKPKGTGAICLMNEAEGLAEGDGEGDGLGEGLGEGLGDALAEGDKELGEIPLGDKELGLSEGLGDNELGDGEGLTEGDSEEGEGSELALGVNLLGEGVRLGALDLAKLGRLGVTAIAEGETNEAEDTEGLGDINPVG